MADVKLCPVCNGRGIVRNDFYTIQVTYPNEITTTGSNGVPVTCRSCNGRGIIFVPEYITDPITPTVTFDSTQLRDTEYLNRPHVSDNPDNY